MKNKLNCALSIIVAVFVFTSGWAQDNKAVFRITCSFCDNQNKAFVQTGFLADWQGEIGIITTLHGVIGCEKYALFQKKSDDMQFINGGLKNWKMTIRAIDFAKDIAFLTCPELQNQNISPLQMGNVNVNEVNLKAIGYPDGSLSQWTDNISYYADPQRKLGGHWTPVDNMCTLRKSPSCDIDVLFVDGPLGPGCSGSPVMNNSDKVIGIIDGGLKSIQKNWFVPYKTVNLIRVQDIEAIKDQFKGKDNTLTQLFAVPSTIDDSHFQGGAGATIHGKVLYGGYDGPPLGIISNYSKEDAIITIMDTEKRLEVPASISYDNQTGDYSIYNVPSGKYKPYIMIEAGYPFDKMSGGDYVSFLSGLNKDIVVAPNDKDITVDLKVVYSIRLKRPVDNQIERTYTNDPPEILYRQNYSPSAFVFEWDPVPGAVRYEAYVALMDGTTNQRIDLFPFNTTQTTIYPDLKVNYGNTYYMFMVIAYSGNNSKIGNFTNYFKNGFGGWFNFKVLERP